jgi:NAD+ diphosphatase
MTGPEAAGRPDPQDGDLGTELRGLLLSRGTVDRMSLRRGDAEWVAAAWADPASRVLVLDNARALVRFGDEGAELVFVAPQDAPDGLNFLLGMDRDGVAYFGVLGPAGCLEELEPKVAGDEAAPAGAAQAPGPEPAAESPQPQPTESAEPGPAEPGPAEPGPAEPGSAEPDVADEEPAASPPTGPEQRTVTEQAARLNTGRPAVRPAGLREAAALLSDRDAGLFTHAVALANWHVSHTHCPRCGTPTVPAAAGHAQRCPKDGSEHFPRIDPAVIMLVTDPAGRCLLARNKRWPERRVSILAGFVEPGESAERAVVREVAEETGIEVARVRYAASQPWPMPQSLMLGFRAEATGDLDLHVDDDEIAEARWYSRDDLRAALASGDVLLPPPVSIAHRLIEAWYGAELPGVW